MSDTSAPATPVSAPAATDAPTDQTSQVAAPAFTTIGGKPYTMEELQAALETQGTLAQRISELSSKEAAIAKFKDKSKLAEVLKEFGHDPDEYATERLLQLKAEEEMDPRDRELAQLRAYRESQERDREEQTRKTEEAKQAETQSRLNKLREERVVTSAAKHGLPASKKAMDAVLVMMDEFASHNIEISEDDAVQMVKQDLTKELTNYVNSLAPEGLLNLLPKETQKALLKVLTDQALAPGAKAPDARKQAVTGAGDSGPKPEWLKKMLDF